MAETSNANVIIWTSVFSNFCVEYATAKYNDVFNGFCLTQMKFNGKWKCCGLNMLFWSRAF